MKYRPRVEMSLVFPSCLSATDSLGTRTITGSDKSYRRAVRRSVIAPILQHSPRTTSLARVPFLELYFPAIRYFFCSLGQTVQSRQRTIPLNSNAHERLKLQTRFDAHLTSG